MRAVKSVHFAYFAFAAALVSTPGLFVACSSDDGPGGTSSADAGPRADALPSDAAPKDAGADASINGCTAADYAANDHSAAADPRVIAGPADDVPVQYVPHCMRVKVGQTVTWTGDLADHPIDFEFIADDPKSDGGATVTRDAPDGARTMDTVTFHTSGKLAFECAEHPTFMLGAVDVVP
jgi:plastocyanin